MCAEPENCQEKVKFAEIALSAITLLTLFVLQNTDLVKVN